jgi:hypothetical protein
MGQREKLAFNAVGCSHREQSKRPIIAVFAGYAERSWESPIHEK